MGRWRHRLEIVLILALPGGLAAQRQGNPPQPPVPRAPNLSLGQVAAATGVMTAIFLIDAPIAHVFQVTPSAGSTHVAHFFNNAGDGVGIAAVIGGLGIASAITRNRAVLQSAVNTAEGVVIGTVLTGSLKFAIGRQRPYADADRDATDFHLLNGTDAGHASFPSGHSTVAFSLATSLGDAINRNWARVALYTLASGTAWARLQQQEHWVTDVLAGAAIGVVSAKLAEGKLRLFGVSVPRIVVAPGRIGVSIGGNR